VKIRWIAAANRDRTDIIDYIAAENPRAALAMDRRFSEAADKLAAFPMIGRIGAVSGTRELFPHDSYRLVYEVDGETVWILALVHTARQWPPVEK
jgi:addiction module RelE/StbE family toxin